MSVEFWKIALETALDAAGISPDVVTSAHIDIMAESLAYSADNESLLGGPRYNPMESTVRDLERLRARDAADAKRIEGILWDTVSRVTDTRREDLRIENGYVMKVQ